MNLSKSSSLGQLIWGNTIGLSWMWGLGLFFSVQFTFQFGVMGLLYFAIPNAIGLFLFGYVTDKVAKRSDDKESLAKFFDAWSKPFTLPLFLYQIAAIALTIFAVVRYLWAPAISGLEPGFIYLPAGILVVLAATFLFGEEFSIKRIKWSHTVMLLIALLAIIILLITNKPALFSSERPFVGAADGSFKASTFIGYLIPIVIGFLVGPWMDIQQWQRAIQIRREGKSITRSYAFGAGLFFFLLMFHGLFANWVLIHEQGGGQYVRSGLLELFPYGHEVLTQYFFAQLDTNPVIFGAYATFICVCILTTLDSGYIALRWFFTSYISQSKSMVLTLMPPKLLTSPIPAFLIATIVAVVALFFPNISFQSPFEIKFVGLEVEFFMILFGTFFVAYSTLGMLRTLQEKSDLPLPQVKMFCVGALSVVVFTFGYLQNVPFFMACGSLIPLGYIIWLFIKSQTTPETREELVKKKPESLKPSTPAPPEPEPVTLSPEALAAKAGSDTPGYMTAEVIAAGERPPDAVLAAGDGPVSTESSAGHFEGKTFVHSFLSTYGDTNSVGNIYFGMYAMWVGKARELFLRKVFPEFDLDNTDFYILTRSFEHKFVREAKEFEQIRIEISIGEHNRKFVELNHKVLDGTNKVLGKGKQTLMFVGSEDYNLLDIPLQIQKAFAFYTPTLAPTLKR